MANTFNYNPYVQSDINKNPPISNLNYTNQDFYSLKTRLVDFIKERFGPNGNYLPNTFNDFVEGSNAIMLIENMAFIADMLSFKIDQTINELFIGSVTQLDNAFRITDLVGFQPLPPVAASSMWTATLNAAYTVDIIIPTPVRLTVGVGSQTINIELFQANAHNEPIFNQDIIIPANNIINSSIIGLEGRTYTDDFTGDGSASFTATITRTPVIYGSVSVVVNGQQWTRVDAFTDSNPRPEFRVVYDSEYRAYVIFGNNRTGLIPPSGSTIEVTYRIGGGAIGNIVSGYVNSQQQFYSPTLSAAVPVAFHNYTSGTGGYDGDTIENIRNKLPTWTTTQNRAVTGSDYKILAEQFSTPYHGQIGKATAVLRNSGCSGNVIDLFVLALNGSNGLAKVSNDLRNDLYTELDGKKMITDYVCIKDGTVIDVDITIEVLVNKSYRKFEMQIRDDITTKVNNFFNISNWDFGKELKDTDLMKSLSGIKMIDNIYTTFVSNEQEGTSITARFYEIIMLNNLSISIVYE